jgi:ATP-dependent RNA helicase DeaD
MVKDVWDELDLPEDMLKVVREKNFESPTSIQRKAIPLILNSEDVIINSATGSGKTLCYVSSLMKFVNHGNGLQAIVIAPTRELVKQIEKDVREFSLYSPLELYTIAGGKPTKKEAQKLMAAEIIISTPGKFKDIVESFEFDLTSVHTLVLDEVDLMLNKEFIEQVEFIIRHLPRKRQNIFASATLSKEITKVSHIYMKKPIKVTADFYVKNEKLKQIYYEVKSDMKFSLLSHLLEEEKAGLSIIFVNREQTAKFLEKNLKKSSLEAKAIYGDQTQGRRNSIIKDFKEQKFDVLIATDLAARGMDANYVTHIYNYTIPKDADKYIHRIGRTARAGASGKVVNFISQEEASDTVEIMKKHKINLLKKEMPEIEMPEIEMKEVKMPRNKEKRHKRLSKI